jgi:hypothetical protein
VVVQMLERMQLEIEKQSVELARLAAGQKELLMGGYSITMPFSLPIKEGEFHSMETLLKAHPLLRDDMVNQLNLKYVGS